MDVEKGLKNSGNSGSYLALLKIFYESIEENEAELNRLFREEDLRNYTIKVHALKSSARIIGAVDLGEKAQSLENAGKSGDKDYIAREHEAFLASYHALLSPLSRLFRKDEEGRSRPEAERELMESVYEEVLSAALDWDCERLDSIFAEMEDYRIPEEDEDLYEKLRDATEKYEYREIVRLLS